MMVMVLSTCLGHNYKEDKDDDSHRPIFIVVAVSSEQERFSVSVIDSSQCLRRQIIHIPGRRWKQRKTTLGVLSVPQTGQLLQLEAEIFEVIGSR